MLEKAKIYAVDEGSSSPSTGSLVDAIDTMSLVSGGTGGGRLVGVREGCLVRGGKVSGESE